MILEYKLSNIQRRKYILLPLIKLLAVIVIATIVGVLWFGVGTEELLFVIGLAWAWAFLMHLLPILVMAARHSQRNRGSYFAIDTVNNTYHYKDKDVSVFFRLSEIDKVIKVVSPPIYDKRIDIMGFGYFFYWKINLVNGRTLSISCMLLDTDNFFGKEATLEKQLFPVPPSNQRSPRRYFVLALLCLAAISGCGQSKTDPLTRKWVSVKVETKDGETGEKFTWDGKPYQTGDTLVFRNGNTFQSGVQGKSSYRLSGNILRIGGQKFLVEKITNRELVLLEHDGYVLPFRAYYVKIDD